MSPLIAALERLLGRACSENKPLERLVGRVGSTNVARFLGAMVVWADDERRSRIRGVRRRLLRRCGGRR